jgi:hypothetical protein
MISWHMDLWLDVHTKGTRLVQFVGLIWLVDIFWNWARLCMRDLDIGCQEITHIEGIKTWPILMGKKKI